MNEAYSEIAWQQLDSLEDQDLEAYNDVMDLIRKIFDDPGHLRGSSDVVTTHEGPRFKNFVEGRYPLAVFWSEHPAEGLRIEAVFPHPPNRR